MVTRRGRQVPLELELLEVVSLPAQVLGNCNRWTSHLSRPKQIFLKIKIEKGFWKEGRAGSTRNATLCLDAKFTGRTCLMKCFAILSL